MMIVKYNRDRHSTVNNTGRMWGMTIVDGSEIGISVKCSFYFKDKISKVFSHGLYGLSSWIKVRKQMMSMWFLLSLRKVICILHKILPGLPGNQKVWYRTKTCQNSKIDNICSERFLGHISIQANQVYLLLDIVTHLAGYLISEQDKVPEGKRWHCRG